jgi:deazaflavin-dependent oxidoreductase (nitroreductase family)
MSQSVVGRLVLGLSAMGFPLTQLAIRRLGARGALIAEVVSGGLLIRDTVLVATGTPGRLRRGPALLLWLETAVAGLAVVVGLRPVVDAEARRQALERRPDRAEVIRRAAVGMLFGLHTTRFRIYLRPDRGRREAPEHPEGSPTASRELPVGVTGRERIALTIHRELDKRLSPLGVAVYRWTKGAITRPWQVDALLLTTRGRRTGKDRTVVLQFFRDGESMVLAAANDGGAAAPGWYHNLTATPTARVEVMDRAFPVRAEELPADAAAAFWPRLLLRSPSYERYVRATSRTIPLVRLTRVEATTTSHPA